MSSIQKQYQLSFTEPYFLDRPLSAGFDLYKYTINYDQAYYQGDSTGGDHPLRLPDLGIWQRAA